MTPWHVSDSTTAPSLGPTAASTTTYAFAYEQTDIAPGVTLGDWRRDRHERRRPGVLRRVLRHR
jgi:hypothetical protein